MPMWRDLGALDEWEKRAKTTEMDRDTRERVRG